MATAKKTKSKPKASSKKVPAKTKSSTKAAKAVKKLVKKTTARKTPAKKAAAKKSTTKKAAKKTARKKSNIDISDFSNFSSTFHPYKSKKNEKYMNANQKKHFENAKQYFSTGKYKAAIHAIDYFLEDYPETDLREEISFIQVKSYFELGKNSIDEKKLQRIKEAIFACNNFLLAFVDGPYNKEVIEINKKLKDIENGL